MSFSDAIGCSQIARKACLWRNIAFTQSSYKAFPTLSRSHQNYWINLIYTLTTYLNTDRNKTMTNYSDPRIRKQLEHLFYLDAPTQHPHFNWFHRLTHTCKITVKRLRDDSSAPFVWKCTGQSGETMWNAYDPSSGWSIFCAPQTKVWAWLSERCSQFSEEFPCL